MSATPPELAAAHSAMTARKPCVAHSIFAGLSANLVGIALARFAYTPLVPTLIEQKWFATSDVVFLGAANLAGYLLGAIIGRGVAARIGNVSTLRWMMALVTAAFFACAFPLSFGWYFGWRLLSGVAGGAIMVLVAATILPHVPDARKPMASGFIFLGLGLGIAGTGTLIPLLLEQGLRQVWYGLGALSAVLTALSWHGWPRTEPASTPTGTTRTPGSGTSGLLKLYVAFGLTAVGLVAPMVFLADFIARGLGWGSHTASLYWILYGVGAICGPVAYAGAAQKVGFTAALRLVLAAQVLALIGITVFDDTVVLAICTFVLGTFPPGIVPLILGRIRNLFRNSVEAQNATWSRATMVFAMSQAGIAYVDSYLFKHTDGQHEALFLVAAVGLLTALIVDLLPSGSRRD